MISCYTKQSVQDQLNFPKGLDELQIWTDKWEIKFNVSKCQIMQIYRSTKAIERFYTSNKQVLAQADKSKYLGVMIPEILDWNPHMNSIVTKGNKCLGIIKRNIRYCPQELRKLAYLSLQRFQLEFACVYITRPIFNKIYLKSRKSAKN